jgi:hypothetical protein
MTDTLPTDVKSLPVVIDKIDNPANYRHLGGHPPMYTDNDIPYVQRLIDEYFDTRGDITDPETGKTTHRPPLLSELGLHLGYHSRKGFWEACVKFTQLSNILKRAVYRIEVERERTLVSSGLAASVTGAIFALKNLGWEDRQTNINVNIDIESIPDQQAAAQQLSAWRRSQLEEQ